MLISHENVADGDKFEALVKEFTAYLQEGFGGVYADDGKKLDSQ